MRLTPEAITIKRADGAQTRGTDGRPVVSRSDISALASVQPDDDDVDSMPEGYATLERRRFNSATGFQAPEAQTGTPGDLIEWNGKTWVVWHVYPWRGLPGLPAHSVCRAYRQQPNRPAAGAS